MTAYGMDTPRRNVSLRPSGRSGLGYIALVGAIVAALAPASLAGSAETVVATGHVQGTSWVLRASDSANGSYCLTMERPRGRVDGTSCGSIFRDPVAHGISYLAHDGIPAPDYIVGPVTAKASQVLITFDDGTNLTLPTIAPPHRLASTIRFFEHVGRCSTARPTKIIGIDSTGRQVASLRIRPLGHPGATRC